MKTNYSFVLGKKIEAVRKLRGLSQAEVAKRMHIDPSAYSRLENGDTMPTADNLDQLTKILNFPVEELAGQMPIILTIHHANGTVVGNGHHVQFEQHAVDQKFVKEVLDRFDRHIAELHQLVKTVTECLSDLARSRGK